MASIFMDYLDCNRNCSHHGDFYIFCNVFSNAADSTNQTLQTSNFQGLQLFLQCCALRDKMIPKSINAFIFFKTCSWLWAQPLSCGLLLEEAAGIADSPVTAWLQMYGGDGRTQAGRSLNECFPFLKAFTEGISEVELLLCCRMCWLSEVDAGVRTLLMRMYHLLLRNKNLFTWIECLEFSQQQTILLH